MVFIVMGVSGCGKTTVGKLLAEKINLPFFDADNFHPSENVTKMSSGEPLNDNDRKPWLEILAEKIEKWNRSDGAVLACSALKESYRKLLISKSTDVQFVYLNGAKDIILQRMKNREGHYMPPDLLDSQFEALEEPGYEAIHISIKQSPEEIVGRIIEMI